MNAQMSLLEPWADKPPVKLPRLVPLIRRAADPYEPFDVEACWRMVQPMLERDWSSAKALFRASLMHPMNVKPFLDLMVKRGHLERQMRVWCSDKVLAPAGYLIGQAGISELIAARKYQGYEEFYRIQPKA